MLTSKDQDAVSKAISILSDSLTSPTERQDLRSPKLCVDYIRLHIGSRKVETYLVLYLDARYRLIEAQEIGTGTIDSVTMYPRALLAAIVNNCARYVVMAHNHPSGDCTPSRNDRVATQQVSQVLAPFDVDVLDHFVVGRAPGFPTYSIVQNHELPF